MPRGQPPSVGSMAKIKRLEAQSSRALATGDTAGRKKAGDELIRRAEASLKEYAGSQRGQETEARKRYPRPSVPVPLSPRMPSNKRKK